MLTFWLWTGGGPGRALARPVTETHPPQTFFEKIFSKFFLIANIDYIAYNPIMFKSLPLTVRNVQATEARLQSIYDAAKLGLKGDSLALAAGMLPAEYRQLCQLDPLAEMAEQKGRADNEREISQVLNSAALGGDAKAALEILRHRHEWTAKQEVSVDVYQRISITAALEQAQTRVLENAKNDLYISRRADVDDAVVVTRDSERS